MTSLIFRRIVTFLVGCLILSKIAGATPINLTFRELPGEGGVDIIDSRSSSPPSHLDAEFVFWENVFPDSAGFKAQPKGTVYLIEKEGENKISDIITLEITDFASGGQQVRIEFRSDSPNLPLGILPRDNLLNVVVEDGTDQNISAKFLTLDNTQKLINLPVGSDAFRVFVRSDADTVPEPPVLLLVASALAVLAKIGRMKGTKAESCPSLDTLPRS